MVVLTADDTTLLKDVGLFVEPIEIYDSEGKFLGLFVPANLERGKELSAKAAAQTDWAEIERRKQSNEIVYPSEVVLERLSLLQAESDHRKATGEKDFTQDEAVAFLNRLRQQSQAGGPDPCQSP